jgi:hypothetical protein
MSLLRKRYNFAFGKSYDMIAFVPQNATQSLITWRSQSSLITCPQGNHSCSRRDNKKRPAYAERFLQVSTFGRNHLLEL